ncbi:pyridoxal kinase [Onthophagus taurus]|uniref:pyridoxal kinase n=1 Tax=Onthophagus taurus TaxID=166361 RepID=UPI000C20B491|nr:pyridoxal kinase isoform X2 [Onthophagus taurus]
MENPPRVLSIQSHVVSGYVGNKSATFPLQLLGFDVDAINSVQFSNHTGYKLVKGQILTDKDLRELMEGLNTNNIDEYTHLLTGYVGATTFLEEIANILKYLKAKNKNLKYVCDPVMGDNGQMYVPKELLPIYKNTIIPLADILVPNQFEVELLTDRKIKTITDAWDAINLLHDKGCGTVVLSSTELGAEEGVLLGLASTEKGTKRYTIEIPKLPCTFTGSGDLFASVFLGWSYKTNYDIKTSLEKTIATLQAVLKRTAGYVEVNGATPRNLELKLIQSKNDIENPQVIINAKCL